MKTYYHIICMRVVELRPDKANYNWTWYRAQSALRAWLRDKVAAEIRGGKRNTGGNSMWSCTIPAVSFLMIIYGYIHYKHRAGPAQACSAGARWKEPLVQTQIPHTQRREAARTPKRRVRLAAAKVAPRLLICNHKVISVLPDTNNCSWFSS